MPSAASLPGPGPGPGRGEDYLIYSDVRYQRLPQPRPIELAL